MKKKILSLIVVLCMLSGIITALPASAVTSSQCGSNVNWTLDDNGTLTISGTGDMWNWIYNWNSPWYSSRGSILNVIIDNGVTNICNEAFKDCVSLTSIGNQAFENCTSLTSINIPDSVISIGKLAFRSCFNLTSINIPGSVTNIGDWAFEYCSSLTGINIPGSVTSIGYGAFAGCRSLTGITILNGVTSIGNHAFSDCEGLTSINIPGSVTSIGDYVFSGCSNLTSINIDMNNNYYSSDDFGVLFNKNKSRLIKYPVKNVATGYSIPNSVTNIGNEAFSYCSNLSIRSTNPRPKSLT
ncbi:MAG: leucine-rich repeat domain-containing protein [Clostridiales bacterium]|nr:leucine-rich repeat domain-containing protein [Clostridiales bacterium]